MICRLRPSQGCLVAVQEAQARINLLFAQEILSGRLTDCKKFNVTTLHSQSNIGNNYNFSIVDSDDGTQGAGTVGMWRVYLKNGFKNTNVRRQDEVNVLIPPNEDWYVINGSSNSQASGYVKDKTSYPVPSELKSLFSCCRFRVASSGKQKRNAIGVPLLFEHLPSGIR